MVIMKINNIFIIEIIFLCAINDLALGKNETEIDVQKECMDEDLLNAIKDFFNVEDCLKDAEVQNIEDLRENKKDDLACYYKCLNHKKSLVTEEGQILKENIEQSISPDLPNMIKTEIQLMVEKCYDDSKGTRTLTKVDDCASFIPIGECISKAFISVCA